MLGKRLEGRVDGVATVPSEVPTPLEPIVAAALDRRAAATSEITGDAPRSSDLHRVEREAAAQEHGVAACDGRAESEKRVLSEKSDPPTVKRQGPTESAPSDAETRWWLPIEVGEYDLRALLDPGASTTVMGTVGLQLASALKKELVAYSTQAVRLLGYYLSRWLA